MSDLQGEDAFDRVLDRMVEAERRAAVFEDRNKGGDNEMGLLKRDLNNARSDLTTAKQRLAEFEKGEDAFVKLYDAVECATRAMLAAVPSCQSTGAAADLLSGSEALVAARDAAKKFIDPIPF